MRGISPAVTADRLAMDEPIAYSLETGCFPRIPSGAGEFEKGLSPVSNPFLRCIEVI